MGEQAVKRKGSPTKAVVCTSETEGEPKDGKVKKLKQCVPVEKCGTAKAIESRLQHYEPVKNKLFARALWNRLSMKDSAGNCEICDTGCERLQVTHLWDFHLNASLAESYFKDSKNMPTGVDDVMNCLLLCPGCHSEFDGPERRLNITADGTIIAAGFVFDSFRKELHGKTVPWIDEIDRNKQYPTSALLKAVYSMPRLPRKYDREREQQLRDELLYEACVGGMRGAAVDAVVYEGQILQVTWDKPLSSNSSRSLLCAVVNCNQHGVLASPELGYLLLCFEHASAQAPLKKQVKGSSCVKESE